MAIGKANSQNQDAAQQLRAMRKSIDNLDAALVCLLAERFQVTERVGHLKATHGIAAVDAKREAAQSARLRTLAGKAGLDPEFAEQLLRLILKNVVRNHRAIARR